MADVKPLVDYSGTQQEIAATDKIAIVNLATGTPDGTKFIRDDGTLATPASSGGASKAFVIAMAIALGGI